MSGRQVPRRRLREQVGFWLFVASAVPLVLLTLLHLATEMGALEDGRRHLGDTAVRVRAAAMEQFLTQHGAALQFLAGHLARNAGAIDERSELGALRKSHPAFLTMLRTDAAATITVISASADEAENTRLEARRASVADRPYFRIPRETGAIYLSDVFRGRGIGTDLIVVLAAPVMRAGRFDGVVQGAINTATFAELMRPADLQADHLSVDVIDRQGQVVYSAGQAPLEVLSLPATSPADASEVRPVGDFGWRIRVRRHDDALLAGNDGLYRVVALSLLGAMVIVLVLLRMLAKRIAEPLETITQEVHGLDLDAPGGAFARPAPETACAEVHAIREALAHLSERLAEVREGWTQAMGQLDSTNARLRRVVDERDREIRAQTADLARALEQAQRATEARERLLANTSHEIRTPLNGIIGSAELLLSEIGDSPGRGRVEVLLRSAEGLLGLLNDLLDLSRLDSAQPGALQLGPVNLRDEIALVAASMEALASAKRLALDARVDDATPRCVLADAGRLRQVLSNLVGNAIKFTGAGRVELDVSVAGPERIRFRVSDTGLGLSDAAKTKVFEPFFQVDPHQERRGSGLGLAIADRLVALMGGALTVESREGVGSRFEFTLMLATCGDIPREQPAAEPLQMPPSLRVLLVDDSETNREIILAQLEALGQRARAVDGGLKALAAVEAESWDLVLMDCRMPGMDGYETTRRIRENTSIRQPLVIALTAQAQEGERERCLAAGMDDHLTKPLRMNRLRAALVEASATLAARKAAGPAGH